MRRPSFVKQRRRLDCLVTFQRRTEARDEFNEPTENGWSELFKARCAVYPAPGYERFTDAQTSATLPVMIEIRSEERARDLLAKDRAVVTTPDNVVTTYNILSPREQAERGDNIRLTAATDEGV